MPSLPPFAVNKRRRPFSDPKRPVLLQTHPGSLRSGSDHDWLLRHGRRKTENRRRQGMTLFAAVLRRSSSGKPDALPLHDVKFSRAWAPKSATERIRRRSRHSRTSKIEASRRAIQPSRETRDLQTDSFHRNLCPSQSSSDLWFPSSEAVTGDQLPVIRAEPFGSSSSRRSPITADRSPILVELDGIEPTASCLQSTRSPN